LLLGVTKYCSQSPGSHSWGDKTTKGGIFLNAILDVCSNHGSLIKWWSTNFNRGPGTTGLPLATPLVVGVIREMYNDGFICSER